MNTSQRFALVLIGMIMGFLLLIGHASAATYEDYTENCRFWKYGEHAFFTGTPEQADYFLGDKPYIERGYCWTASTWTLEQGIETEHHLYSSDKEAMRKFITEENERVFGTQTKNNKVESLLAELEAEGVDTTFIKF